MNIIFRDDDVDQFTELRRFRKVHQLFLEYGVVHTIAVVTSKLDRNTDVIKFVNDMNYSYPKSIDIQFHCHTHIDYTINEKRVHEDLQEGIKTIQQLFAVTPKTWYPPFNKYNHFMIKAVEKYNMNLSYDKSSLMNYVLRNGLIDNQVLNFHYWDAEVMFLEPALQIFNSLKK